MATIPSTPTTPAVPDDATAWAAVLARDARLDGAFVYAVRTTGVFCRPTCPSRRPRRENVSFFAAPADAERAGYRACARCGPASTAEHASAAVSRAVAFLEARLDEPVTLDALSRHVGLSPFHLQRTFRRALGVSPRAFQAARRLERFKEKVRAGEELGMATYEAGFGSSRALYEGARAGLGMTPGTYRKGAEGERIAYTTVSCRHGRLLVAATPRGVCSLQLGDDDAPLESALRAEFPRAVLARDDAALGDHVAAVLSRLDSDAPGPAVPLDLRGTAFQLRVWRALQDIPRGETRSYRALAAAIGSPAAVRAVGRACATNRVALVVPCHRVVREDGQLGGYRWGVDRKRRLLDEERAPAPDAPPADRRARR